MTERTPTAAEQAEIDAFQNGVYGAEPPDWWLRRAGSNSIPTESVETAARHLQAILNSPYSWDSLLPSRQDLYRGHARELLEAAATHLTAEAWDEGYEACLRDEENSHWGPTVTSPNPYKR